MCDVPSIAVFCNESVECFPDTASKFFFRILVTIPLAPVITGIIVHFRFHIRCISIHKILYFNFFSASFCTKFLSAGIATTISVHVLFFVFDYCIRPICCNFSVCVYCLIPQHCDISLFYYYYYYYYYYITLQKLYIDHVVHYYIPLTFTIYSNISRKNSHIFFSRDSLMSVMEKLNF